MTMKLTDSDILLGRSKQSFNHVGNQAFRALIANNVERYAVLSTKREKMTAVSTIFKVITEGGGRFLKQDVQDQWIHVEPKTAKEKISHALRDQSGQKRFQHVSRKNDSSSFMPQSEVPSAPSNDCWRTIVQETRKESIFSTPEGLLKAAGTFSRQDPQSSDPWYQMLLKNSDLASDSFARQTSDSMPRVVSLESSSSESSQESGGVNAGWAFPPPPSKPTLLGNNNEGKHPSHLQNIFQNMDITHVIIEDDRPVVNNNNSSNMPASKLSPLQSFLSGQRTTTGEPISEPPKASNLSPLQSFLSGQRQRTTTEEPISEAPKATNLSPLQSFLNGQRMTTEEPISEPPKASNLSPLQSFLNGQGSKTPRFASASISNEALQILLKGPLLTSTEEPSPQADLPRRVSADSNMEDHVQPVEESGPNALWDSPLSFKPSLSSSPPLPENIFLNMVDMQHVVEEDDTAPIDVNVEPQVHMVLAQEFDRTCDAAVDDARLGSNTPLFSLQDKVLGDPPVKSDKDNPFSRPLDMHRIWDQDDDCLSSSSSCEVTSIDMSVTLDIASIDLSSDDLSIDSLPSSAASSTQCYTDPQLDDMIVELFQKRATPPIGL